MNSQLTVYKASAGSGKTFTLAKEYMVLVIQDPSSYRNILAVRNRNGNRSDCAARYRTPGHYELDSVSRNDYERACTGRNGNGWMQRNQLPDAGFQIRRKRIDGQL